MKLNEIVEEVNIKIQDDANNLSNKEIEIIIVSALNRFSRDCPRLRVADISGDGNYDYDLPSDWVQDFSIVASVEYPAGEREPTYIEDEDWIIYDTTSTRKLRFLQHTPLAGETARINYTTLYLKSTITNIPSHLTDAFATLAAAECCFTLARMHSQSSDPTINADAVNYSNKSDRYSARGKELIKLYKLFVTGSESGKPGAAGGIKDLDLYSSVRGHDRLTHPQRQR